MDWWLHDEKWFCIEFIFTNILTLQIALCIYHSQYTRINKQTQKKKICIRETNGCKDTIYQRF